MTTENKRVLVLDDDRQLLEVYREILQPADDGETARLLAFSGQTPRGSGDTEPFQVTTVSQGGEGVACVRQSLVDNEPFAVAFMDIRMPPGIDGLEAARQIRELDDRIYLVMVTAYSDKSIDEIQKVLRHDVLFVNKPVSREEVRQMARNACKRWGDDEEMRRIRADLERQVQALSMAGRKPHNRFSALESQLLERQLTSIRQHDLELFIHTDFQDTPMMFPAKIVRFEPAHLHCRVHPYQAVALENKKKTTLSSCYLPFVIQAAIESIDVTGHLVTLTNLTKVSTIRDTVLPDSRQPGSRIEAPVVEVKLHNQLLTGQIVNMDLVAANIRLRKPDRFTPQWARELVDAATAISFELPVQEGDGRMAFFGTVGNITTSQESLYIYMRFRNLTRDAAAVIQMRLIHQQARALGRLQEITAARLQAPSEPKGK